MRTLGGPRLLVHHGRPQDADDHGKERDPGIAGLRRERRADTPFDRPEQRLCDRAAVLIGQVARDAAGGERLQCRDQKWQVAERAERKLERILELGTLDRDVAMEARTQVRRNDEQALVEFTAQRDVVDGRLCESRIGRSGSARESSRAPLVREAPQGNARAINEVLTINSACRSGRSLAPVDDCARRREQRELRIVMVDAARRRLA